MRTGELDESIDDVLRGDKEAFRRILHAHGLALRSYIATMVHALDDIDDLAQEVFLTAFRQLADFRRGDDFGAWLRGIARHKVYHHLRGASRRGRALARFQEQVLRTIEGKMERAVSPDTSDSIELLLRCIGRLPDRMRQVVRSGLDGGKPADLAQELSTSVGAVYRLHARANQLLRDCMTRGTA
jgi:RNA polymerase sigma-70 factor (ECF subfamily)